MATDTPVWFITGASSGFGKTIALEALDRGQRVIATARNVSSLAELGAKGAHTMSLDVVADDSTIETKVAEAMAVHGLITHVVNCAGYILEGMIEESSTREIFDQFNVNVFGSIKVIRAVLPHLREATTPGLKVIANFGSTSSWTGWPSSSVYCSSKWAISGLTEGLAAEVAPFGIKATVIEPGTFRTRFLAPGSSGRQYAENHLPAYKPTRDMINGFMDSTHGAQLGDVGKGAKVIVDVLTTTNIGEGKEIPIRLLLGSDSVDFVRDKCVKTTALITEWEEVIRSTDSK
ncbi:hypothetical protein G7Z17_g6435 [Cylindrodendrum hubeiense]|uniref:Uncharacterized protein n=1 Tax=Cylindrodendrum hubeiense TaxID=595255 RepID=A0A9P5HF61_9HYPO|nr:hypothetical protein G7Z17_g6435 [Cylindrodendrum hubeiense]